MTLLPFFEWCEATWIGTAVRESIWAFPVIEALHLLGLSLLGGSLLIVDLRMLGLGLTRQTIPELARDARPWLLAAIAVMAATGTLLFLSEAVKCYYSTPFRVKVIALPVALLFTFTVREPGARRTELVTGTKSRILGATSIALWLTVAAAGRWIGFS